MKPPPKAPDCEKCGATSPFVVPVAAKQEMYYIVPCGDTWMCTSCGHEWAMIETTEEGKDA